MSLSFHPTKPSLLVGGSYNGEIFLWNLSKDEDMVVSWSKIDDYYHKESIT
jgi:WD40 repeat protein